MSGMRKYLAGVATKQMADLRPKDAASLAEFKKVIEPALRHMLATEMPRPEDVVLERAGQGAVVARPGSPEKLPVAVLHPLNGNGAITRFIRRGRRLMRRMGADEFAAAAEGHIVSAPVFYDGDAMGANPLVASRWSFAIQPDVRRTGPRYFTDIAAAKGDGPGEWWD
jgi:hypothetical protein